MSSIEVRKVLKLGSSSLVVTLPNSWVKMQGLKSGDRVLVSIEGDSLRIKPVVESQNYNLDTSIDIRGREPRLLRYIVPCAYVLGFDNIKVLTAKDDPSVVYELRRIASRLVGVNIEDIGSEVLNIKILVDHKKIDLKSIIKSTSIVVSRVSSILYKVLEEGLNTSLESELEELKDEMYKLRSLIERYIHTVGLRVEHIKENHIELALILSVLVLLSLANSIILDTISLAGKTKVKSSVELLEIIKNIQDIPTIVGSTTVNPSVKRALEILNETIIIQGRLEEILVSRTLDNSQAIIASKLTDVIKIYQVIAYSILCVGLFGGVLS